MLSCLYVSIDLKFKARKVLELNRPVVCTVLEGSAISYYWQYCCHRSNSLLFMLAGHRRKHPAHRELLASAAINNNGIAAGVNADTQVLPRRSNSSNGFAVCWLATDV
jgi:hypothetical protein